MRQNYLFKKLDPKNAVLSTRKKNKLKRDFLNTASLNSTSKRFSGWTSRTAKLAYGAGLAVFVMSIVSMNVFGSTTPHLYSNTNDVRSNNESPMITSPDLHEQRNEEGIAQSTEDKTENGTDVQGVNTESLDVHNKKDETDVQGVNTESQEAYDEDNKTDEYPSEQQCIDPNGEDISAITLTDALAIAGEFYDQSQVHKAEFKYEEGVGVYEIEYEDGVKVIVNSCTKQALFENGTEQHNS